MKRKPMQVTIETIVANAGLTEAFEAAQRPGGEFHLRIECGGWMPLVIDITPEGFVAVTHYTEMNHDAVADPEIVFYPGNWLSVEITQGPVGVYRRVAKPGQQYYPGVEDLARMWARNLRDQGFTSKDVVFSSLTHDAQLRAAVPSKVR